MFLAGLCFAYALVAVSYEVDRATSYLRKIQLQNTQFEMFLATGLGVFAIIVGQLSL